MRIHALGRPVLCVRPPRGLGARPGLAISEGGPFYPVRMRYRRSCLDGVLYEQIKSTTLAEVGAPGSRPKLASPRQHINFFFGIEPRPSPCGIFGTVEGSALVEDITPAPTRRV
jgi:hypothetical protein